MAIWQFRVILIPQVAAVAEFGLLPPAIPKELAEDLAWWSKCQPPTGFERHIDSIFPEKMSWSSSMRMWGDEDSNDAYVAYSDESKAIVEEVSFRIDARSLSSQVIGGICRFAKQLDCVLMPTSYEILQPDETSLRIRVENSNARKFVIDPEATLRSLDDTNLPERLKYLTERDRKS
jgi:hypothetical protein